MVAMIAARAGRVSAPMIQTAELCSRGAFDATVSQPSSSAIAGASATTHAFQPGFPDVDLRCLRS